MKPGPAASTWGRTGGRPLEQRGPLARVRCALRGPLELGPGLIGAAQFVEQVAAHAGQQVVAVEGGSSRRRSTISSAACGPNAIPTATARLSRPPARASA